MRSFVMRFIFQILIIQFGGIAFSTAVLNVEQWVWYVIVVMKILNDIIISFVGASSSVWECSSGSRLSQQFQAVCLVGKWSKLNFLIISQLWGE